MLILVVLCLVLAPSYAEEDGTIANCCGRPDKQRFIYRVSEYNCPCSAHTTGILRYHDNHIQYCNGKEFVTMGVATPRVLGSKENPAKSCPHILEEDSDAQSGLYYIKTRKGVVTKTYCYMGKICGSKGWTMIMKIDGSKTTFNYNSLKWKSKQAYNEAGASGGLDNQETKLDTYYNLPFNKLCLGMRTSRTTRWLRMHYQASSLYSLIHDNKYRATHLGRTAWKSLVPDSSLQRNCNKEGFNVHRNSAMARIGIIANQENDCNSPDSRIGFGTGGGGCGQDNKNTAGNEARCSADNGDKSIESFGYIFAQGHLEDTSAPLGSYDNPARSCRVIKLALRASKNGMYYLRLRQGSIVKTYCYMQRICGTEGWTMIMKINGHKRTFHYGSAYWRNKATYNRAGAYGGLDNQETKLQTYSDFPFGALCLGMKTATKAGTKTKWLKLNRKATSLYSLIADNKYRPTYLKRNAWKSLVPDSSLQRNCNKEGFNVHRNSAMARIGIVSNQENDCNSPDSRIGFGTGGGGCGQDSKNTAGNEARCSPDNRDKSIKSIGYIFAQ